jgi:hypothetical protein
MINERLRAVLLGEPVEDQGTEAPAVETWKMPAMDNARLDVE